MEMYVIITSIKHKGYAYFAIILSISYYKKTCRGDLKVYLTHVLGLYPCDFYRNLYHQKA